MRQLYSDVMKVPLYKTSNLIPSVTSVAALNTHSDAVRPVSASEQALGLCYRQSPPTEAFDWPLSTPSARDSQVLWIPRQICSYFSQIKMRQLYSDANKVPIHKILNSIPFGASVTADDSRKQVESLCSLPAPLRAWDRLLLQVRS